MDGLRAKLMLKLDQQKRAVDFQPREIANRNPN